MPNLTQDKLDALTHKAFVQGVCAAAAHLADDQREPGMAAEILRYAIQKQHLNLATPHDRKRLVDTGAAGDAWHNS